MFKRTPLLIITLLAIKITHAQNIGIGTITPKYSLHLHSNLHTVFNITDGSTGDGTNVGTTLEMLNSNFHINNKSGSLSLGTMGSTSLFISSNIEGYVGINTTTPLANLHLKSRVDNNEAFRVDGPSSPYQSFYNNGVWNGYLQATGSSFEIGSKSALPINFYTGNTQRMTILNNGYVGIGTTPNAPLHIVGSNDGQLISAVNTSAVGNGIVSEIGGGPVGGWIFGASAILGGSNNKIAIQGTDNGPTGVAIKGNSINGTAASFITVDGKGLEVRTAGLSGVVANFMGIDLGGFDMKAPVIFTNTAPKVGGTYPFVFQVTASGTNPITISNLTHANSATDMLFVQHVGVAANVNSAIYVKWSGTNWNIYTESGTTIPAGEIYNVMVIKKLE